MAESLWKGRFGDAYHARNPMQDRYNLWKHMLSLPGLCMIQSAVELGAGQGDNLQALAELNVVDLAAVEINPFAAASLRDLPVPVDVQEGPVQQADFGRTFDLAFTRGLLIHIPPDDLSAVYDRLAALSHRFVLMMEYYSPQPRQVTYHGQEDALWLRDFAGEFLARHPGYRLADFGFLYHGDPVLPPEDDLTWFLLENVT